jgi:hypothetical protein
MRQPTPDLIYGWRGYNPAAPFFKSIGIFNKFSFDFLSVYTKAVEFFLYTENCGGDYFLQSREAPLAFFLRVCYTARNERQKGSAHEDQQAFTAEYTLHFL